MTTVAIDISKLEAAVATAQAELTEATTKANEAVAAIMGVQPVDFPALAAAAKPVDVATNKLATATKALEDGKAADRWESSIAIRQPVLDVLKETVVDAKLSARLSSVSGSIKVAADGSVTVSLAPTFEKPSLESIEALVASGIDAAEWTKLGFADVAVSISGLTTESPVTSIAPASALNQRAREARPATGSGTTRSGALEYEYKNEWLGSKALLTAVLVNEEPYAVQRRAAFEKALETGNGVSNYAKDVAGEKGLNLPTRNKPAAE